MELKELYKQCLQNSITAQKYLFDMFSNQMFLLCRRYVKHNEQAEEVLMNGFLKVFLSLHKVSYINDAAFVGWIKKIMVNESLQYVRTKEHFLQAINDEVVEIVAPVDIDGNLSTEELYKLILQLPIGYRIVFNLFEIEGYSHKEIASILNITEGTSKSQLSKAKKVLQQLVEQQNKGGIYARK
jgi:RNA polymerase sigma factor (sigma-70 family)